MVKHIIYCGAQTDMADALGIIHDEEPEFVITGKAQVADFWAIQSYKATYKGNEFQFFCTPDFITTKKFFNSPASTGIEKSALIAPTNERLLHKYIYAAKKGIFYGEKRHVEKTNEDMKKDITVTSNMLHSSVSAAVVSICRAINGSIAEDFQHVIDSLYLDY